MEDTKISREIVEGFHLFWDNFPFPVMLNNKDNLIIDCNSTGTALGYLPGTYCYDRGVLETLRDCQAEEALEAQNAVRKVGRLDALGLIVDSYWIPLPGHPDLYVHFGIDITEQVKMSQPDTIC